MTAGVRSADIAAEVKSYWRRIFQMSVINGSDNCQDLLPVNGWRFPKHTWFQERLEKIRKEQGE